MFSGKLTHQSKNQNSVAWVAMGKQWRSSGEAVEKQLEEHWRRVQGAVGTKNSREAIGKKLEEHWRRVQGAGFRVQ